MTELTFQNGLSKSSEFEFFTIGIFEIKTLNFNQMSAIDVMTY